MDSTIKLEYELLGPVDWEEGRLLYKDVAATYKLLLDEGFERADIQISFKCDGYLCNIKNSDISIEGELSKKISLINRDIPSLEEFLMDAVKELDIHIKKNGDSCLKVSVRKDTNPCSYKVEAHTKGFENVKALQKINYEIERSMALNSKQVKRSLGPLLEDPIT
jgi:hypothetical protein